MSYPGPGHPRSCPVAAHCTVDPRRPPDGGGGGTVARAPGPRTRCPEASSPGKNQLSRPHVPSLKWADRARSFLLRAAARGPRMTPDGRPETWGQPLPGAGVERVVLSCSGLLTHTCIRREWGSVPVGRAVTGVRAGPACEPAPTPEHGQGGQMPRVPGLYDEGWPDTQEVPQRRPPGGTG